MKRFAPIVLVLVIAAALYALFGDSLPSLGGISIPFLGTSPEEEGVLTQFEQMGEQPAVVEPAQEIPQVAPTEVVFVAASEAVVVSSTEEEGVISPGTIFLIVGVIVLAVCLGNLPFNKEVIGPGK